MFRYLRPLLFWLSLLGGVFALLPRIALANNGIGLSEDRLVFQGLVNQPLQRTFTLIAPKDEMPGVEVVRKDLVDPKTHSTLLSNNIKVAPEAPQKGMQRFLVTITGPDAGHFTGNLELHLKRKTAKEERTIALNVETFSPNVDTDSNSKTLTLPIQPGWGVWPWRRPTVNPGSPKLGEISLKLLQNGAGPATVEKANVLTMRGTKGNNLPDGAVTLGTPLPMDLQRHEAKTLKVVVRGNNIPADEYNGILYISVSKQPNPVQVPLQLRVKDGPFWPLLLLIIGPIAGVLIHWWNSAGWARNQLRRRIESLESQIDTAQGVQMDVKGQCHEVLNNAKTQLITGQKPEEIEKLLEPLPAKLSAARASSDKFLQEELEPLREKITGMKPGEAFKQEVLEKVGEIETAVNKGELPSLEEARNNLKVVEANVGGWEDIIASFKALPDPKDKVLADLNKAETLRDMRQIITSASTGVGTIAPALKAGFVQRQVEIIPATPTWSSFTLSLKLGHIAVAIVLYLFTLAVGYITIYAKAPTFGADLENYITLFLWGVSVNFVGAQAIDLKAMFAQKGK